MDYKYSYFLYSIIFLGVWAVLFGLRKDMRRKMLLFSLVVTPMGPISELWFLRDYWQRPTITGWNISIEDFIFAFSVGGMVFSIYPILFRKEIESNHSYSKRSWLSYVFPLIVLFFMLFFTNLLKVNSIFSSAASFFILTIIVLFLRRDLIKPSLLSGLFTLIIFLGVYQGMRLIFPTYLHDWCNGCNPTGIRILEVNIEELIWDFSWGIIGSVIYLAIRGKGYAPKQNTKLPVYLESFENFNSGLDKRYLKKLSTKYGGFMAVSSKRVLSIRFFRQLAYWASRVLRRNISESWMMLLVSLLAPLLNFLLIPFGLAGQGTTVIWLFYFAILNYCLLSFPQIAWSSLIKMSDTVDEMLDSESQRNEYISWMSQRLNLPNQVVLSTVGGAMGILAIAVFTPFLSTILEIRTASYVSVVITASLGLNAVYWLWGVPLQLYKLFQFESLKLTWNNPSGTPGVREQSRLLGFSAILSAIGLVLFVTPLLWVNFSVHPNSVYTSTINTIAFIASMGTVVFIAISPQYWLSAIVYREKNKILDELGKEIIAQRSKKSDTTAKWELLESKINVYHSISTSSTYTVDMQTLANYAIAFLTTILPYIIQWLTK